jgi:dolichol kinase
MSTPPQSTAGQIEQRLRGELGRRLVHASGTGLPIIYLLGIAWRDVAILYLAFTIGAVALDMIRLYTGLDWWIYEHLTREYEQDNPAGYVLYMLSSAVTWFVFDPAVAVPAIMMLTLGDPISGIVGSGELRFVKRPTALAIMFAVCVLIAVPFHYAAPPTVIAGAVGGTLADGVKLSVSGYIIDDNLTIPVVAGAAMQLAVSIGP